MSLDLLKVALSIIAVMFLIIAEGVTLRTGNRDTRGIIAKLGLPAGYIF
jgi:hypothetical protein